MWEEPKEKAEPRSANDIEHLYTPSWTRAHASRLERQSIATGWRWPTKQRRGLRRRSRYSSVVAPLYTLKSSLPIRA